jgi:hypothetical protein
MKAENYPVDVESLHEHFPPHFPVPKMLTEFAEWVKSQPWLSVGEFRVTSEHWFDYGDNACDLYRHFALFLRSSSGDVAGYWLPEGTFHPDPPVVVIGSEGQFQTLGDSLSHFLERLARRQTGFEPFDDRDEEIGDHGELLLDWLRQQSETSTAGSVEVPDFAEWWKKWQTHQDEWRDHDPIRLELGERLIAMPPDGAEDWWTASFDAVAVGDFFRTWHRKFGPQVLAPEQVADIEQLIKKDRLRRAETIPERGLWFYAWITVMKASSAYLRCDFISEPREDLKVPEIPLA